MENQQRHGFQWLECGSGKPIVLVSGLMGVPADWRSVLDSLGTHCRGFALGLPELAESAEFTIASLADEVVRFLDVLGIERTVIGGNSIGGQAALEVALCRPDRIDGLVLTGATGLPDRNRIGRVPRHPSLDYVRTRMLEVVNDPAMIPPGRIEEVHRLLNSGPDLVRLLQLGRASRTYDASDRIGEIRVPVLLIWGAEDRITPPDIAHALVRRLVRAKLVLFPDTGHAPMFERPADFGAAVARWLRELG